MKLDQFRFQQLQGLRRSLDPVGGNLQILGGQFGQFPTKNIENRGTNSIAVKCPQTILDELESLARLDLVGQTRIDSHVVVVSGPDVERRLPVLDTQR